MTTRFGRIAATLATFGLVITLGAAAIRAEDGKTYGSGVSLTEVTPIAALVTAPAAFEGKTVRVYGTVTAVCAHMGCWMALAQTDSGGVAGPNPPTVRLKVDDGVIVFPVSAKGRRASAQGVIERVAAGGAEAQEAAGEHARAEGKKASDAAQWHIKVTGAVVY